MIYMGPLQRIASEHSTMTDAKTFETCFTVPSNFQRSEVPQQSLPSIALHNKLGACRSPTHLRHRYTDDVQMSLRAAHGRIQWRWKNGIEDIVPHTASVNAPGPCTHQSLSMSAML